MPRLGLCHAALATAALTLAACGAQPASAPNPPRASATPVRSATFAASPPAGSSGRVSVPNAESSPTPSQPWFLTIGDSVTYGYTVDPARSGVNSGWPVQLAALLNKSGRDWRLMDTACPGETLATYRTGCGEAGAAGLGPLPQRDTAMAAVRAERGTLRAIFIDLGSNDLLEAYRSGAAKRDPAAVIGGIGAQLSDDVAELRAAAPDVPLIVANFYDPIANTDPSTLTAIAAANAVVGTVAARNNGRLADFASAINTSPPPDPHLCDYVDCRHFDIHPTVAGHAALAAVALRVLNSGG